MTRRYGAVTANAGIDLAVMPGSIHAILGENGAGKSTLMKLIYGVERPDAGRIVWKGAAVSPASPADARALGIGMVFQHFSLFETMSVLDNVSLIVPGRRADLEARIRALGADFGLTVDPQAMVHALSVGERQRVEIIRCLLLDPELLIVDEPTSVLPPQGVARLFGTLRGLRDRGVSILFISHKLEEIRALCDTATVLRAGRVEGVVDPRAVSARDLARMMMGCDMPAPLPAAVRAPGEVRLALAALDHPADAPFGMALAGIDLTVRAGQIVGIAGVSGNGQKELAALISGETLVAGSVQMMGAAVGRLGPDARRARGFAFVPEERLGRGAVPEMSLADNALLTAHRCGMVRHGLIARGRERAFTARCIESFDVRTPGPGAEAGALSGGNLQKFIMAREMLQEPALLLVSQPTWGVDIGAATAIRQRLVALRNAGTAILVISEEIEELFEICDILHVLHQGRLSPPLPASEVTVEEVGAWMMGAGGVAA